VKLDSMILNDASAELVSTSLELKNEDTILVYYQFYGQDLDNQKYFP